MMDLWKTAPVCHKSSPQELMWSQLKGYVARHNRLQTSRGLPTTRCRARRGKMLFITSSRKSKGCGKYDGLIDNVEDQPVINTGDDKTSSDV